MTKFLMKKGVTDILYSIEVFDGFPEVPNKDMVGLKKVEKPDDRYWLFFEQLATGRLMRSCPGNNASGWEKRRNRKERRITGCFNCSSWQIENRPKDLSEHPVF